MDFLMQVLLTAGLLVTLLVVAALWTVSDMRKRKGGDSAKPRIRKDPNAV